MTFTDPARLVVQQVLPPAATDAWNVRAESFGAVADDVTDDGPAFTAAIAAAAAAGQAAVYVPPGTYFMGTTALAIDVAKVSLYSDGLAVLRWSTDFAGTAIWLYATADYTNQYKTPRAALRGLALRGGGQLTPLPGTGLQLGRTGAAYEASSLYSVEHVIVEGFATALRYLDNTWRVSLTDCAFRWGDVAADVGLLNMGENLHVTRCMFNDGCDLDLGTGFWKFDGCSFDNSSITVRGDTTVDIVSSHFENPGNTGNGYRMGTCVGAESRLRIRDTDVVLNPPPVGSWRKSLFEVDAANVTKGLELDRVTLVMQPYFDPSLDDGHRLIVAGTGRAIARGLSANNNGFDFAIARASSGIHNGDFAAGTTAGWRASVPARFTADAATKKAGTHSGRILCAVGESCLVYADIPVEPGAWLWVAGFWKLTIGAGATPLANGQITYNDESGAQISSRGYSQPGATFDWANYITLSGVVPAGAKTARVTFYLDGGGAGAATSLWLDEWVANLA